MKPYRETVFLAASKGLGWNWTDVFNKRPKKIRCGPKSQNVKWGGDSIWPDDYEWVKRVVNCKPGECVEVEITALILERRL